MRNKALFQALFLTGLLSVAITATLQFGQTVGAIISASTVVLAIFNSLFKTKDTDKYGNGITQFLNNILQISPVLISLTIALWAFTLYSATSLFNKYSMQHSTVSISGKLISSDNSDISNARVEVLIEGNNIVGTKSDTKGLFKINNIPIDRTKTTSIPISAKNNGNSIKQNIDINNDDLDNIELYFETKSRPFQEIYYILEGASIDCLLNGNFPKEVNNRLSGNIYVVHNEVYKYLYDLKAKYKINEIDPLFKYEGKWINYAEIKGHIQKSTGTSEATPLFPFPYENAPNVLTTYAPITASNYNELFFNNTWTYYGTEENHNYPPLDNSFYVNVSRNILQQKFDLTPYTFIKEAKTDDIIAVKNMSNNNNIFNFFLDIFNNKIPENMIYFKIYGRMLGISDECSITTEQFEIIGPSLKTIVLTIKNISGSPIRVEDLLLQINNETSPRTKEEDIRIINNKQQTKYEFPIKELGPNETLIAPLYIYVTRNKDLLINQQDFCNSQGNICGFLKQNDIQITCTKTINFFNEEGPRTLSKELNSKKLLSMLDSKQIQHTDTPCIVGPSINISSITINNNWNYFIHQFDPHRILITAEAGIGSCPYVHVFSDYEGKWNKINHILVNLNSKTKKDWRKLKLSIFNGTIKLTEMKNETTYLDSIYISYKNGQGELKILKPLNAKLLHVDDKYETIDSSSDIIISFPDYSKTMVGEFYVHANGYYIYNR